MKLFFVTYWSVADGLSVSTVYLNLRMLAKLEHIEAIYYFTVEHDHDRNFSNVLPPIDKVEHIPIVPKKYPFAVLTKAMSQFQISSLIENKAKEIKPALLLCHGAMAGIFGYKVYKKQGIPFITQSFEPHGDYMVESGVWSASGPKYYFQKRSERKIKKYSKALVTVSHNYRNHLVDIDGVAAHKVHLVPNYVQLDSFAFNEDRRAEFRQKMKILDKDRVGVYLGKFGSIYYDEEAFSLFKESLEFFKGNFFLLLLTPTDKEEVQQKLKAVGFPLEKVHIHCALHEEVPYYLSAADFAFSTIKVADCRKFCSPIKDGEYWALGLPIVLPEDIGDDSDIIKAEGGGAIIDIHSQDSIKKGLTKIQEIIGQADYREDIRKIAIKHRNVKIQEDVYQKFFGTKAQFLKTIEE